VSESDTTTKKNFDDINASFNMGRSSMKIIKANLLEEDAKSVGALEDHEIS